MPESLLDEFRLEPHRRGGPKPLLQQIMHEMEPQDAEDLSTALNDIAIPAKVIVDVLKRRGFTLSVATVQKHRRDNGIG